MYNTTCPSDPGRAGAESSVAAAGLNGAYEREITLLRETVDQLLAMACIPAQDKEKSEAFHLLVTQLREANQNLVLATFGAQDKLAYAQAASLRQTEFLAMLAHELRTPLQPLAMANDLLCKRAAPDPTLAHVHGVISRQIGHMSRLIDDLLDASRVSSGKINLQLRPLLLSDVIDSAVEASQAGVDKRQQMLRVSLPKEPLVIEADLVRMTQVLTNLLVNASKFTQEAGHIDIVALRNGDMVGITVTDNGAGIARDEQPFVFDLFTQGFRSLDRAQGGLGIGLSLVRSLTQMHGGTVEVFSAGVGRGSQFMLKLPLSSLSLPAASVAPPAPIAVLPRRILLIEDNADAAEMLGLLLEYEGHHVDVCVDGTSGLRTALDAPYDVIVCDIGLPGMDGFQVAGSVRAALHAPLPCFVAASGYSNASESDRAGDPVFDHYLVKPINIDTLSKIILAQEPR